MTQIVNVTIDNRPIEAQFYSSDTREARAKALQAEAARAAAALSEAAAESLVGPTYASTSAGLAATSEGGSFAVDNGDGTVSIYREVSGSAVLQRTLLTSAAASATGGAARIGRSGGATVQDFVDEIEANNQSIEYVSKYGDDDAAVQEAIDTGAKRIIINLPVTASQTMTPQSGQTIECDGGKIIVAADHTIETAVFNKVGGSNVKFMNMDIDASATDGVPGIRVLNVIGVRIFKPKLKKCNVLLESSDNTIQRITSVEEHDIDMDGYLGTAIYVSGMLGWAVTGGTNRNGLEGVAFYNNTRAGIVQGVKSEDHTQDSFLANSAQDVTHSGCIGIRPGQSCFTTQRQASGQDTRNLTYSGCLGLFPAYDCFDIRGRNSGSPYGVDTGFVLNGCIGIGATFCAFYVVLAEGTTLTACMGFQSGQQNLFIDTSDRCIIEGFRSISGANDVASGANKAGILVFNSNGCQFTSPVSGNSEGATQHYGISFTGTSTRCRVKGGDLSNNVTGPFFAGNNAIEGSSADTLAGVGVFFLKVSERGRYVEEGYGAPTHARALGSDFQRLDGGGEFYKSNGGGAWRSI